MLPDNISQITHYGAEDNDCQPRWDKRSAEGETHFMLPSYVSKQTGKAPRF
jgi:hypothetical protein